MTKVQKTFATAVIVAASLAVSAPSFATNSTQKPPVKAEGTSAQTGSVLDVILDWFQG